MVHTRITGVFALGALLLLSLFLASCSNDGKEDTFQHPSYLRLVGGEPLTLDPHLVTDVGSHAYTGKLFGGLLRLESALFDKNGKVVAAGSAVTKSMIEELQKGAYTASAVVVPDLAESLPSAEYGSDGTVSYTFVLREDARFSNGRTVTAWDVAYSLERAADPRTRSTTAELYLGNIIGVMDMQRGRIINRVSQDADTVLVDLPGIRVINERTIRLTIREADNAFLMKLTYPTAAVVDKRQTERVKNWTDRPNGTGSYMMTKRDVAEIVLEANPYYYGGKPAIGKAIYYLSGGSSYPRFQNNELDISGIGIADLALLAEVRDPNSLLSQQYFSVAEMSTSYIGFQAQRAPFDDARVRRAFAMAIDLEALAHNVMEDLVVVARSILPPGMPGYRADAAGIPYDPAAARALLEEAKFFDTLAQLKKQDSSFRLKLTISGSGSSPSVVLQSIVEFWRTNLNADVELEQLDYPTFLEEIKKGNFQMFSLGWVADYPEPGNFLDLKLHSQRSAANNETRYRNAQVDELLDSARVARDPGRSTALYQSAEDLIMEDVPWIPLFHGKSSTLIKPYLCGYYPTAMGISILQFVDFCK